MDSQQPEPQRPTLTMSDLMRWGNTILSIATPIVDALAMTWIRIREDQIRQLRERENANSNRGTGTASTGDGNSSPTAASPQPGQGASQSNGIPDRPVDHDTRLQSPASRVGGWPHK